MTIARYITQHNAAEYAGLGWAITDLYRERGDGLRCFLATFEYRP